MRVLQKFSTVPIVPLRPYVERLWGWESDEQEIVQLPTLLPGTGAEIFFHYGAPFVQELAVKDHALAKVHLICVRRKPIKLRPLGGIGFIAVRIRAGRLHRFVTLPGGDLIDRTLSAEDLWDNDGRRLSHNVFNARSRSEALGLIQCFLLERLERCRTDELVENAVSLLYRNHAQASIQRMASELDITRRELERRFKRLTAQTPVVFRKLSRLQHVMRELLLDRSASVLEVALSHGFYDQAHFIHGFAELGLGSPQQHLAQASIRPHFYNTSWHAAANNYWSSFNPTERKHVTLKRQTSDGHRR